MRRTLSALAGPAIAAALAFGAAPALGMGANKPPAAPPAGAWEAAVKAVEDEDYRQAVRLLTGVVADQPRNADALNYLGFSHRRLGAFDKAVAFYRRALAVDPDHRGANEYLGRAWLALGELAKAEARLSHLWNLCGGNCEEYRALDRAIADYKNGVAPRRSSRLQRW